MKSGRITARRFLLQVRALPAKAGRESYPLSRSKSPAVQPNQLSRSRWSQVMNKSNTKSGFLQGILYYGARLVLLSSLKRTSETPDAVFFPRLRCFHTPHPTCPLHFDNRNNHPDPMPLLLLLLCCPLCPLCELGLLPPCHHQTLGRMLSWRAALLNAVWPIGGWLQRKIKSAGGMAPPPELNQPRRS